jgi:hypothetical protein
MSKRKERAGPDRLEALLRQGDHAEAKAEARRLIEDALATEEARRRAAAVLASIAPEPGAVGVGAVGLVLALAVTGWLLVR